MSNIQWHFFDKVFRRWVVLQVSSFDDFRAEMESCKFHDMDLITNANAMCLDLNPETNGTGQRCIFIWLNGWSLPSLVHEIAHLVMYSFRELGIPISMENTETFAHYTEYWYTTITRAYRKYPNGISPKEAR